MAFVCKNGEIVSGHNIPEVAYDRVREFVRSAGYKGDIKIPIGPYDQSKYCHVQQSLSLVKMLGDVAEIGQIEIVNDGIHVVSRNGESRDCENTTAFVFSSSSSGIQRSQSCYP
jgi:hypothetical protein